MLQMFANKTVKASNRNDDPAGYTLDQCADLIGFTNKMKNVEAEADTTYNGFMKVYYISAGQTNLLQVQWEFYIGTCFYVAYHRKNVKLVDNVN